MNQQEYELIAGVFLEHRKQYGGRTDSVTMLLIDDMTNALEENYDNFNRDMFIDIAKKEVDV